MQSKKRFTEINIWESAWFMNLNNTQKLFWFYLNDRCDNIGVWSPNFKLAIFNLNIESDQQKFKEQFLEAVNATQEKIQLLENGNWFLKGFVKFQFGKLNPKNPAHKSYLKLMEDAGLLEWFQETYPEIMPKENKLWETSQSTSKDPKEYPKSILQALPTTSNKGIKKKSRYKINKKFKI